jgi:hypothetical protein
MTAERYTMGTLSYDTEANGQVERRRETELTQGEDAMPVRREPEPGFMWTLAHVLL